MDTPRTGPSEADAGMEVAGMGVGLGIITMALFPFALPGLLLFVVAPLLLLAVPVLLLAAVLVPPLWLARIVLRSLSRRREAGKPRPEVAHRSPAGTVQGRTRPRQAA